MNWGHFGASAPFHKDYINYKFTFLVSQIRLMVCSHLPPLVHFTRTRVRFPPWSGHLCKSEYIQANPGQDRGPILERVPVCFQTDSDVVCFLCEYKPTSIRPNYRKHTTLWT
ncbi:hypothetical protein GOODEAATRI_027786 [Goodea atripinnis]|uniref:Uncharacterized protein n=1 Tax=Goodea atripinnis TaxID=208336 RepID=A0ABV0N4T0_9TELE